jgi:hypothetical protein
MMDGSRIDPDGLRSDRDLALEVLAIVRAMLARLDAMEAENARFRKILEEASR